jgi:hypothetical protein
MSADHRPLPRAQAQQQREGLTMAGWSCHAIPSP